MICIHWIERCLRTSTTYMKIVHFTKYWNDVTTVQSFRSWSPTLQNPRAGRLAMWLIWWNPSLKLEPFTSVLLNSSISLSNPSTGNHSTFKRHTSKHLQQQRWQPTDTVASHHRSEVRWEHLHCRPSSAAGGVESPPTTSLRVRYRVGWQWAPLALTGLQQAVNITHSSRSFAHAKLARARHLGWVASWIPISNFPASSSSASSTAVAVREHNCGITIWRVQWVSTTRTVGDSHINRTISIAI